MVEEFDPLEIKYKGRHRYLFFFKLLFFFSSISSNDGSHESPEGNKEPTATKAMRSVGNEFFAVERKKYQRHEEVDLSVSRRKNETYGTPRDECTRLDARPSNPTGESRVQYMEVEMLTITTTEQRDHPNH